MKNLFTAFLLALSVTIFSCSNSSNEEYNRAPAPGEVQATTPATDDPNNFIPPANIDPASVQQQTPANQPAPATQQAAAQTSGPVEHFRCPAGHVGGGSDAAGKCTVCGAELEHNAAYHQQPGQTQNQPQPVTPGDNSLQPEITPVTTPTNQATNAAGVFHYICPDGHPGGAAAQENCSACGKQLVHNDKYHQ